MTAGGEQRQGESGGGLLAVAATCRLAGARRYPVKNGRVVAGVEKRRPDGSEWDGGGEGVAARSLIPEIVGCGGARRVGHIAAGWAENRADVARLRIVEEIVDAEVEADLGFGGDAPGVADGGGGDPVARRVDDGEGVDVGVVDALRGIRGVDDGIGAAVTDDGAAAVAGAATEAQAFEAALLNGVVGEEIGGGGVLADDRAGDDAGAPGEERVPAGDGGVDVGRAVIERDRGADGGDVGGVDEAAGVEDDLTQGGEVFVDVGGGDFAGVGREGAGRLHS